MLVLQLLSRSFMPPVHENAEPEGGVQALLQSFAMIIFSEIGDKTFLIAAILAMRHPRVVVFAGALGSLIVMSILSAAMGHILPTLIPKKWTQVAAAVLFLVFGSKMLVEARQMKGGNEKIKEEMREAEEEIKDDEAAVDRSSEDEEAIPMSAMEEGEARPTATDEQPATSVAPSRTPKSTTVGEGLRNFCSLFLGPVFVQAFVLTFLGEWGDRSQIATIALGAAHNVYLVALGTIVGHSCCTALAVIGGRYISTKISVKHVTLGGAILFLLFGIIYLYEAFAMTSDMEMSIPISPDDQTAGLP
ncbi:GDT1-like protein C17G8.08c [Hypsizygus marmoreus]|uniref:GDT1 family protein n=1 Tax=Hypsizygus marmoreus TaxID=39966 RepID=A0A369K8B2_HYPMA|nr:GDT1-like protein C17G8.08c [Hypsizygus marmoreus]